MICENSNKGQVKHFFKDKLPESKIIFWDTNFVVDALFPPNLTRFDELKQKQTKEKLSVEEYSEFKKLEYISNKHDAAVNFMEMLIKEKINIAFSSILFTEVYFVIKYIELDKVYKDRATTKTELRNDPKILEKHVPEIIKNWNLFLELLSKFNSRTFPINPSEPDIIKETLRVRTLHGITSNDALHIGTILAGKQKNVVVFDRRFAEVCMAEGIDVWKRFL